MGRRPRFSPRRNASKLEVEPGSDLGGAGLAVSVADPAGALDSPPSISPAAGWLDSRKKLEK